MGLESPTIRVTVVECHRHGARRESWPPPVFPARATYQSAVTPAPMRCLSVSPALSRRAASRWTAKPPPPAGLSRHPVAHFRVQPARRARVVVRSQRVHVRQRPQPPSATRVRAVRRRETTPRIARRQPERSRHVLFASIAVGMRREPVHPERHVDTQRGIRVADPAAEL